MLENMSMKLLHLFLLSFLTGSAFLSTSCTDKLQENSASANISPDDDAESNAGGAAEPEVDPEKEDEEPSNSGDGDSPAENPAESPTENPADDSAEDEKCVPESHTDKDGDCYSSEVNDCDDNDPKVYLGAPEIMNDGIDQNCDGRDLIGAGSLEFDDDGDGYTEKGGDCNDNDAAIHLLAAEICDEIDNDCDGQLDADDSNFADSTALITSYQDMDGDGYGNASVSIRACNVPSGYVLNSDDCDDAQSASYNSAVEVCDGIDNDCDGAVDSDDSSLSDVENTSTYYVDVDGDGFGDADESKVACLLMPGYVINNTDCDDGDRNINPLAHDTPADGVDQNCDGLDDSYPMVDADGDGYYARPGYDDCDDSNAAVNPGISEVTANSIDDDCDGYDMAADVLFVTPDGTGTACTREEPCSDLATALSLVADEGTIAVLGGRYSVSSSLAIKKGVTIIGEFVNAGDAILYSPNKDISDFAMATGEKLEITRTGSKKVTLQSLSFSGQAYDSISGEHLIEIVDSPVSINDVDLFVNPGTVESLGIHVMTTTTATENLSFSLLDSSINIQGNTLPGSMSAVTVSHSSPQGLGLTLSGNKIDLQVSSLAKTAQMGLDVINSGTGQLSVNILENSITLSSGSVFFTKAVGVSVDGFTAAEIARNNIRIGGHQAQFGILLDGYDFSSSGDIATATIRDNLVVQKGSIASTTAYNLLMTDVSTLVMNNSFLAHQHSFGTNMQYSFEKVAAADVQVMNNILFTDSVTSSSHMVVRGNMPGQVDLSKVNNNNLYNASMPAEILFVHYKDTEDADQCNDGLDNDADGLTDCSDSDDCAATCQETVDGGTCSDGLDNDGDSLADCSDPSCVKDAACIEKGLTCTDGLDNDGNGLTDCDDEACSTDAECVESGLECVDSIDNNSNGLTDCKDPGCSSYAMACGEASPSRCSDSIDNDANGLTDCEEDSCSGIGGCPVKAVTVPDIEITPPSLPDVTISALPERLKSITLMNNYLNAKGSQAFANMMKDPLFDTTTFVTDPHLRSMSPMIDVGFLHELVTSTLKDVFGNSRLVRTKPDIGAEELE